MFTVRRSHGWALHSSRLPIVSVNQRWLSLSAPCRAARKLAADNKELLNPHGPVAEKLAATKVWLSRGEHRRVIKSRAKNPEASVKGNRSRLNVVNDKLCDDILSVIGPSLERHRGCDILDINPGAGLWSAKLHKYLEPRSHVMMEPDAELYRPFLKPLLDKPGTTLTSKSGIIWHELYSVLTPEYFPHQVVPDADGLGRRNDTLLVIANLAHHPKQRFVKFDSMTSLVLHQLIDAVRTNRLVHRYGLVRMLLWTRDDEVTAFIPKNIQRRGRQAVDVDLLCDSLHEVCGSGEASNWFLREEAIDHHSSFEAIKRMEAANLHLPRRRQPEGFAKILEEVRNNELPPVPGTTPPVYNRPYLSQLADLQAVNEEDGITEESDYHKMLVYKWRSSSDIKKAERLLGHSQNIDEVVARCRSGGASETTSAAALELKARLGELPKTTMDQLVAYRGNLQAYRQTPPLLHWDRRLYEPLTVKAEEFYPNVPCRLLDIQPKAPHPLLRQTGPRSNRAADTFDVMVSTLMMGATQSIGPAMDALSPGAADYIMPRWTNYNRPNADFFDVRLAEPTARQMNGRHWEEILELWMEWPFRPEFYELVARTREEIEDRVEDLQGSLGAPQLTC